jgi:hypothetical protein
MITFVVTELGKNPIQGFAMVKIHFFAFLRFTVDGGRFTADGLRLTVGGPTTAEDSGYRRLVTTFGFPLNVGRQP